MAHIDIFNGDADGICALTQLRNANPVESTLVTGVKRDINLLSKVDAQAGDELTVLDVSLDKNRDGLQKALDAGANVFYVDHHFAGEIPESPALTALINTTPDVCTSLLVNTHLGGKHVEWAVTGAFGDNLKKSAQSLAKGLDCSAEQLTLMDNLGTYLNYNGYGSSLEDLHFAPAELYKLVSPFPTPFAFVEEAHEAFEKLEVGYREDMASAQSLTPAREADSAAVFILPDEAWARRVSGVYSNDLANANPSRAHAVLTEKKSGTYLVSVRAPMENKTGADELCRQFPTGGGRAAAAGINDLPADLLESFIDKLTEQYKA
ncbi:MAG: DHH family phosphoesterase [Deltaproteobacteria bacterium]|nr:DHH family phosphoesterase [Deltaproteobacteria bacterium]